MHQVQNRALIYVTIQQIALNNWNKAKWKLLYLIVHHAHQNPTMFQTYWLKEYSNTPNTI